MGVGVAPATEYLKNSKGFEQVVDKIGAVQVDEYLKVKGLSDVYAIGECNAIHTMLLAPLITHGRRRHCLVPSAWYWRVEEDRALERELAL